MNVSLKTAALAAGLLALPFTASAFTITQANVTATGDVADGVAAPASRFDVDNIYDGDTASFYSLGDGGSLTIDVSPLTLLSPATVLEVTFGTPNSAFPESAQVFFGADLAGELFNDGSFSSESGFTISNPSSGANGAAFEIAFSGGPFSSLTFLDTTMTNFAGSYNANKVTDGFDIAEISVNAVPLPPALALFFAPLALLGLIGARRRRAAA
ncbi:hypothetical protein [Pikeienuella sp. HZG-20]|uniref:hypothetical protein n=1 Tax=Paludibacillus litoralis TaxID=3133267 RepID=UPI0030EDFA64